MQTQQTILAFIEEIDSFEPTSFSPEKIPISPATAIYLKRILLALQTTGEVRHKHIEELSRDSGFVAWFNTELEKSRDDFLSFVLYGHLLERS